MSAIFGIINKSGRAVERHTIQKMQQALVHRATDGAGLWHSGNVFFGYHKLIISPRQQEETMPVEDEQYVITADARIDNRDHLAALIGLKKGDQPVPNDPLLILAAYKKWGETCADYLEGEFAFAIWDKQANSLFCAVDHIGFRPFYYYDAPDVFIFCSEMKGILAVKETGNIFNEVSLIEYFFRQSDRQKHIMTSYSLYWEGIC